MNLGLNTANRNQGGEPVPAGSLVELIMKIRPGSTGLEDLLKRSSNGKAEGLDVEYKVLSGEYKDRRVFSFMILDGETAGHGKAGEISRTTLRAIFEAVHGIDPNDTSAEADAKRTGATLAGFNGATFLATLEIERGGERPEGGRYRDKNVIGKVLRIGDKGYRKLEQPPPQPIERSAPPATQGGPAPNGGGAGPGSGVSVARPGWAQN
jgi:hypothetical protein